MSEITKEYFDNTIHELKKDVQTEIGALRTEVGTLRKDVQTEIGSLRTDVKAEVGTLRTEVGALFENIDDKLGLIIESQSGMRDDLKILKTEIKRLDDRVSRTEIRLDVVEAR